MWHVWAILDGYWKMVVNDDKNVGNPDVVLQMMVRWCEMTDQWELPTYGQMRGLIDNFIAWKTGTNSSNETAGPVEDTKRKGKKGKGKAPAQADVVRDNYNVPLERKLDDTKGMEQDKEKLSQERSPRRRGK